MQVKADYTFDGDAKVSEVTAFLRERHLNHSGWDVTTSSSTESDSVGGYRSGKLRIALVEEYESSGD